MLKCGHAANAKRGDGRPSCAICGCAEPADMPDLTGRQARCHCGKVAPSDPNTQAFFEYCGEGSPASRLCARCHFPETAHNNPRGAFESHAFNPRGACEFDTYYCGHAGWN